MLAKDNLDQPWDGGRTVDPAQIERFQRLAGEWWNPDGRFRASTSSTKFAATSAIDFEITGPSCVY